ncbi:hypothetical protein MKW94_001574, partial [Papaver nudicaule]|nr:hypothetical protein [Papaver nudicaule]
SLYINNQTERSKSAQDKKKKTSSNSKVEFASAAREQLCSGTEGSSRKKLDLMKQSTVPTSSRGIIEINDSEDEKDISEQHTCNITGEKIGHVSTDETVTSCLSNGTNLAPNNHLKRSLSDQNDVEGERSFDEGISLITLSSTTKRCRIFNGAIGRSECQDEDTIPIGKLLNLHDGGQKVGKLERSFPLKQCVKKNNMSKRTSGNESAKLNDVRRTAKAKRNKLKQLKWHFEADMLSSFEEDPELCMRAICALYRQQNSTENSTRGSLQSDKRGFTGNDIL